jgi:hypothetical protein
MNFLDVLALGITEQTIMKNSKYCAEMELESSVFVFVLLRS